MVLEDGALEVLHHVGLAVEVGSFLYLAGDGVALLGQTAVLVPVVEEDTSHSLASLREGTAGGVGARHRLALFGLAPLHRGQGIALPLQLLATLILNTYNWRQVESRPNMW